MTRPLAAFLAAALGPLFTLSAYMVWRGEDFLNSSQGNDALAMAASVLLGTVAIQWTPLKPMARVFVTLFYPVLCGMVLLMHAFTFCCVVYGNCP